MYVILTPNFNTIHDDWYKYQYNHTKKCYYPDPIISFMFCFFLWFYCSCRSWTKCHFVRCYGSLRKKIEIIKYSEEESTENARGGGRKNTSEIFSINNWQLNFFYIKKNCLPDTGWIIKKTSVANRHTTPIYKKATHCKDV